MWIVKLALDRPYTFVVLAIVIALLGPLAAVKSETDIFPRIDIPVIAVVFSYDGMPPDEMAGWITSNFERSITTTVNNVEHIEGRSIRGYGIVKIFFQPYVDIAVANAQVTAVAQTKLSSFPPGTNPPLILNYSASTVPILQLALSAEGLSEGELADLGLSQIRPQLANTAGASVPFPFGGKQRQIRVQVDPDALRRYGLSGSDVSAALQRQNQVTPVGPQKIGATEYVLILNNAPRDVEDLADMPIREVNGTVIRMRDVGSVVDDGPPQTNVVRVDGKRSVLLRVFKNGKASTISIVEGVKKRAEEAKQGLAADLDIRPLADQSLFVKAALFSVAREGTIAAILTGLMTLLFLGSWRPTVIIALSIPLSILAAIATLYAVGETLNIMTLGGLALAVGILVDDATVTIENINTHLEEGEEVDEAVLNGAGEIALPVLVSVLCICVAFVPMFFLEGVPGYLFAPLALSVVFAMGWSFVLSRTFVPTCAKYLLRKEDVEKSPDEKVADGNLFERFQGRFFQGFDKLRDRYRRNIEGAVHRKALALVGFAIAVAGSMALLPPWDRAFSLRWTRVRSPCTSGRPSAPAWRRPRIYSRGSTRRFERLSRPTSSTSSWTTSA